MASLRALAGWLLAAACLLHVPADANDFYFRASVLDCNDKPVQNAYVSVWGCTDKADSSLVSATAAESKVIKSVNASNGYAGENITENIYCPDLWDMPHDQGLRVDYCSGSSQNDCNLAVMQLDPSGAYNLDDRFEPLLQVFQTTLQKHVLTTEDPSDSSKNLYRTIPFPGLSPGNEPLWCPSPFPVCSYPVFRFKPKSSLCARPPMPPPPTCTDKCPGLPKVPGSCNPIKVGCGETGYAVMCALDKCASNDHSSHDSSDDHSSHDSSDDHSSHDSRDDHSSRDSRDDHSSHDSRDDHSSRDSRDDHSSRDSRHDHSSHDSRDDHSSRDSRDDHSSRDSRDDHSSRDSRDDHSSHDSSDDHSSHGSSGEHSTSYPTFTSFCSRQSVYASYNSLFTGTQCTQPNNCGWMGQWPKTYLAGNDQNCCTVRGKIYAGCKHLAGTVSAFMKAYSLPANSPPRSKRYSLTVTVNVKPNRLRELHIYFRCTKLATNALDQFDNHFVKLGGLQQVTKTVSVVCPEGGDPKLYTAIKVKLN